MFSHRTNWKLETNLFTRTQEELRARGEKLLDLSVANPTECGFEYDAGAILAALQNPRGLEYDPQPKGLRAAREAVARYYQEDQGAAVDPEALILTTSTSEAYSYVFRLLCNPHDEILVPKPSYPLFDFLADLQDVTLVPYSLEYAHGWFVDFHSVIRALTPRTRAVLLVHPNNPTGSYQRAEEIQQWNQLCRDRNLALIVDEVFLDYPLDGIRRPSFVTNRDALTFTLNGLSKIAGLPQMKIGWLAASGPQELTQGAMQRLEVIADTFLSVSSPSQYAVEGLLEQRKSLQRQIRERVRENLSTLRSQVSDQQNVELLDAEGGWYAVLRVSGCKSEEELAIELMREHRVIVHPGHFFDFPREGYLVLSLIAPTALLRDGCSRLLAHLS